jgi:hypothetical protein
MSQEIIENSVPSEKISSLSEVPLQDVINDEQKIKKTRKKSKTRIHIPKVLLTEEFITGVLIDRHHSNMTVEQIKNKHKISQKQYKEIMIYSDEFIEKFGNKKKPTISLEDLQKYWEKLTISL